MAVTGLRTECDGESRNDLSQSAAAPAPTTHCSSYYYYFYVSLLEGRSQVLFVFLSLALGIWGSRGLFAGMNWSVLPMGHLAALSSQTHDSRVDPLVSLLGFTGACASGRSS